MLTTSESSRVTFLKVTHKKKYRDRRWEILRAFSVGLGERRRKGFPSFLPMPEVPSITSFCYADGSEATHSVN